MPGKHKRSASTFSAHDKLVHKSCLLLRREAKKVRTFLVRKVVQQLKQVQQQTQTQEPTHKLHSTVCKLEREHAALKALDLDKIVDKARIETGLEKPLEAIKGLHVHETVRAWDDEKHDKEVNGSDCNEKVDKKREKLEETVKHRFTGAESQGERVEEKEVDAALVAKLMDRVLAHKQIVVLLDAIRRLVEKEERDSDKKRRAREKKALKRGRHESLVGNTGRSGMAPTSLFLGSLSGRGRVDDDELEVDTNASGMIDGADGDIAEFLGEKKKSKNRPGQVARRMKAIRKEEALKRKEDRAHGLFVPYKDPSVSITNYGPSERPKKAKLKASKRDRQQSSDGKGRTASREAVPQKSRVAGASTPGTAAHPSWLAKQKQKEKEKVSLTAFSGKKITFD